MATFKSLQVLRLAEAVRTGSEPRVTFPKGTRVTVINTKNGVLTVRTSDAREEQNVRLALTVAQVEKTRRGRPRKTV